MRAGVFRCRRFLNVAMITRAWSRIANYDLNYGDAYMQVEEIREILGNREERGNRLLRAIANYPDWYVAVDADHCAWLWEIEGKQTLGAMTERKGPGAEPREYLPMRGRHLLRHLPAETQMIGFDMGSEHGVFVEGDALARLKGIALALDCEEALAAPKAPSLDSDLFDDVGNIVDHEWIALWNDERPLVMPFKGLEGAMLFTAFDTVDAFLSRQPDPAVFQITHMRGGDLFKLLDARDDIDGVYVNAGSELELYPFAPAQIHELANGRQPRPERKILRARCIAELHHFLDECGMVKERPHLMEYARDQLVAHYTGEMFAGLEARSFRFYPVTESSPDGEWGEGPTEIVCAGKLADLLRRRLESLKDEPRPLGKDWDWKPFIESSIVWANELLKLIDPRTNELPRRTLRTVDGARFVREYPDIATRDFAVAALAELQAL